MAAALWKSYLRVPISGTESLRIFSSALLQLNGRNKIQFPSMEMNLKAQPIIVLLSWKLRISAGGDQVQLFKTISVAIFHFFKCLVLNFFLFQI